MLLPCGQALRCTVKATPQVNLMQSHPWLRILPPQSACLVFSLLQVAMLFLVKGPLRHEALWRAWFERAEGLMPAQAVSNALCASEDGMPAALSACSSLASRTVPQHSPAGVGAPPTAVEARNGSSGSSTASVPPGPSGSASNGGSTGSSGGRRITSTANSRTRSRSSRSSTDRTGASSIRRWLYERWQGSGGAGRAPGVLDRQHLFDVYVHPHPNFTG